MAFNFPPFVDGSAVTVAKRVLESARPVDVVAADLSRVRTRDRSLAELVAPYVRQHHSLTVPIKFAAQASVAPFVTAGIRALAHRQTRPYRSVYSRSMWPHSHFLAARVKIDHLAARWTAEFSDPMLWHVDGGRRPSPSIAGYIDEARVLASVGARAQRFLLERRTVLEWAQFVPFLLADELVFTNEQQRAVMLEDAPTWLQEAVLPRSVIAPHPTLPPQYYGDDAGPSAARASDEFRIGYFGTFYPNRGGGELLEAVSLLPTPARDRLRLDVYASDTRTLMASAGKLGLSGVVRHRSPLPFRRFLAASGSYDALLVNDIATSPFGVPSPFLPSKYSDYAGSSAPTMAITIPGSPLDLMPARWKAHVGDVDGISRMLRSAIEEDR
ncbi:hypothetical protein [Brachybacterium hainanense]|uniref:Glycosyltransferase n=1 Tax=Brachybacterium hainanense TaxID=1541174 RepID=A0ABV6RG44_9MICO